MKSSHWMFCFALVLAGDEALAQSSPLSAPQTAETDVPECMLSKARELGVKEAQEEGRLKWGAIGACSTCLLPCGGVGCLGATAAGYVLSDANDVQVRGACMNNDAYVTAYKHGYESEIKKRNAVSAFSGGAIVAVVLTVAYVVLYTSLIVL